MQTRLITAGIAGDRLLEVTRIFAILCLLSAPFWATMLLFPYGKYNPGTAIITWPLLIVVEVLITGRVAKNDRFLREVMLTGVAIRYISTSLFFQLFFRVWNQAADLPGYYNGAEKVFETFYRSGHLQLLMPFKAQNVVLDLAGLFAIPTGLSLPGLCLIFSFLSFLGEILFYKSFCRAFPDVSRRFPAMLFFMLPSMLFWTSFISKDSLIFLMLALSLYGFVRLQSGGFIWVAVFALGVFGAGLIRPHIGGMLGVAYTAGFLFATRRKGYAVVVAKLVMGPLLLVATWYLIANARALIKADTFDAGVSRLQQLHAGLETGGSSTGTTSLGMGIALAPLMAFRPLIYEVRNPQMAVSCFEGMFIFVTFWNRRKGIWHSLKKVGGAPHLLAAAIFCAEFAFVFSIGMGNVGTLVRERTMMMPFWFFIVFSVEPPKKDVTTYTEVRRLRALREIALRRGGATPAGVSAATTDLP